MVVEVREKLPVDGELLFEPGAVILGHLGGHHRGAIAVNMAHTPKDIVRRMDSPSPGRAS
jgi:hypothetical protein